MIRFSQVSIMMALLITISGIANAQVLFTYGNKQVTKQEFERAYAKNPSQAKYTAASLQDYLDLYVNFKLKVQGAKDLGYHQRPSLLQEINSFRQQVYENYVLDSGLVDKLTLEAAQRNQKLRNGVHFFIPYNTSMSAADTVKAVKYAQVMQKSLALSNDYNKIIDAFKQDAGLTARYNMLHNISAFALPYTYEQVLFNTPLLKTSQVFRMPNGWHIIKVLSETPNPGTANISVIMLPVAAQASVSEQKSVFELAQKIKGLVTQKTITFEEAVETYSQDVTSRNNKGRMDAFTPGTYAYDFEKAVFSLKPNEISNPILTEQGWYIVKMNQLTPVPSIQSLVNGGVVRSKVLSDARINTLQEQFKKTTLIKTNTKKLPAISFATLSLYADSMLNHPARAPFFAINKQKVASLGKEFINGDAWLSFIQQAAYNPQIRDLNRQELWNEFLQQKATQYYIDHLENYNTAFRYQLDEFTEGNLLFEIMEQKVWGIGSNDEAGLKKLYNANPASFSWEPSADVSIYTATSSAEANTIINQLKAGATTSGLQQSQEGGLSFDSGRYEISYLQSFSGHQQIKPVEKTFSPIYNAAENNYTFFYFHKLYPGGEPRSFEEARGIAVTRLQDETEKKLLKELRTKYPVKINQDVFRSLIRK